MGYHHGTHGKWAKVKSLTAYEDRNGIDTNGDIMYKSCYASSFEI